MSDRNAISTYRRAIARVGQSVTFRRISGEAPTATVIDVTVRALVATDSPGKPVGAFAREGEVSQQVRRVIVLDSDLSAQGFTLPLRKNDKVTLDEGATWNNLLSPDPNSRNIAGATTCRVEGV